MKENSYKPQMPDVMEAIFDAAYLLFDLVAAMVAMRLQTDRACSVFYDFRVEEMLFIWYQELSGQYMEVMIK